MTSRNKREGQYVGFSDKHVRKTRTITRKIVNSGLAYAITCVRDVTRRIASKKTLLRKTELVEITIDV